MLGLDVYASYQSRGADSREKIPNKPHQGTRTCIETLLQDYAKRLHMQTPHLRPVYNEQVLKWTHLAPASTTLFGIAR